VGVLAALAQLQAAAVAAAASVDRLRPRDREFGSLKEGIATLPLDVAHVRSMLTAAAEGGLRWPVDISKQDGRPVDRREQLIAAGVPLG
jgi:hypothetical protein